MTTTQKNMVVGFTRNKKSVKINKVQLKRFSKWYSKFDYKADAQEQSGIDYRVIDRLLLTGTCSPATLSKIESLNLN